MTTTIHIFGDTGGHGVQLFAALQGIGVDLDSWTIPEGTQILHLGDLIHRGPLSNLLIKKVDLLMERNPGQWLQVLGNHEFQHIIGGISFWSCECSEETLDTIQRWYDTGTARVAWALEGLSSRLWTGQRQLSQSDGVSSLLASHGGLTVPTWDSIGQPATATLAAAELNRLSLKDLRRAGLSMGQARVGLISPVWAMAATEVFPLWNSLNERDGLQMPFSQTVGHSSPYSFGQRSWWSDTPEDFRAQTELLPELRASSVELAGQLLLCMDPGYGKKLFDERQPSLQVASSFDPYQISEGDDSDG